MFRPHCICPHSRHVCFPHLHCSGCRLVSREWALSCMHFQPKLLRFRFSGTPQRCRFPWASVLCLPCLSSSGTQELDEHTLFRCSARYPLPVPCLNFWACPVLCTVCLFWEADLWLQPSQWMSTIQNLRKTLVRDLEPVCNLVGGAVSEAEFAPFPSPLPPASSRAGPVCSQLAPLDLLGAFVL